MKAPCIQLGTSNISTSVSKILNELRKLGYIVSVPPPHISPDLYIVTNLDKLRGKVGFTPCVEKSYQRERCATLSGNSLSKHNDTFRLRKPSIPRILLQDTW